MLWEITLWMEHLACDIEVLVLICWILLLNRVRDWILVSFCLPSLYNLLALTYLRTLLFTLLRTSLLCCWSLNCGLIFATRQYLTHIEKVPCLIAFIHHSSKLLVDLIRRGDFVFGRCIKTINSSRDVLNLLGVTCITSPRVESIRAIFLDI